MKFSANLGFLWTECPLPEAIYRAKDAGFDAVECHFPYDQPIDAVQRALAETGLPMLGLNTVKGAGLGGLAALPERIAEARAAIGQAIAYGAALQAKNVHVMAGITEGPKARATFLENLNYASAQARAYGMHVVIEPLNGFDVPGYFLNNTNQAIEIIEELSIENIRLMFDCYHVGRTEGDVIATFERAKPYIGHIQFAGVPDRGQPDQGTVDYKKVFAHLNAREWDQPLGAEYKVSGSTEATLDWMKTLV